MRKNGFRQRRDERNLGFIPFSLAVYAPALDVTDGAAGDYVKGALIGIALYAVFGK